MSVLPYSSHQRPLHRCRTHRGWKNDWGWVFYHIVHTKGLNISVGLIEMKKWLRMSVLPYCFHKHPSFSLTCTSSGIYLLHLFLEVSVSKFVLIEIGFHFFFFRIRTLNNDFLRLNCLWKSWFILKFASGKLTSWPSGLACFSTISSSVIVLSWTCSKIVSSDSFSTIFLNAFFHVWCNACFSILCFSSQTCR